MIIDQSLVNAGGFPRSQQWWDRFMPAWVTVTVGDTGFIALTAADPEALRQWIGQFPRIACAVIPDDEAPYGTGGSSSPC